MKYWVVIFCLNMCVLFFIGWWLIISRLLDEFRLNLNGLYGFCVEIMMLLVSGLLVVLLGLKNSGLGVVWLVDLWWLFSVLMYYCMLLVMLKWNWLKRFLCLDGVSIMLYLVKLNWFGVLK